MKLIDYRGLNCYLNCLVNAAAHMIVNYAQSFVTLWSEIDFSLEEKSNVYFTVRLEENLKRLGCAIKKLPCASKAESDKSLDSLITGEPAVIGMDMHDVPWSPVYNFFYGPHYFLVKKDEGGAFVCFDPTYYKTGMVLPFEHTAMYAYDICKIEISAAKSFGADVFSEAEQVICSHPKLRNKLFSATASAAENRKSALLTAKYVDALINNRYLFKHYLAVIEPKFEQFFDKGFFSRWEAVKNGLHKAYVMKDNTEVLSEVRGLIGSLLFEETVVAETILAARK